MERLMKKVLSLVGLVLVALLPIYYDVIEDSDDTNVLPNREQARARRTEATSPKKSVVYLHDPAAFVRGDLTLAGLTQGTCDCAIVEAKPWNFANLDWETVGAVIVFELHMERDVELLELIPPGVVKILYWREAKYPMIQPELQAKFDIIMGTHFTDAVLNPCHYPSKFPGHATLTDKPFSERTHLLGHVSGDCHSSFRNKFIKELQKHIDVEVYGGCATQSYNISLPPWGMQWTPEGYAASREFYSSFKFFLAVENEGTPGYVSEKIFNSLEGSAVPVYLGASRIKEFPKLDGSSEWFINARDFPTVEALADFLVDLASDEERFKKYLEWNEYAQSGGMWMPDAPDNIKECFETKNGPHHGEAMQIRHEFICKLCSADYLETVVQRGRENMGKIGFPSTWEIEHDYGVERLE